MQQSMESQKVGQNLEMEQQQSREKVSLHWLEGKKIGYFHSLAPRGANIAALKEYRL